MCACDRYVILGDGCQMEGISNEACSLAGHWGLGKLIAFYDDNHISIDGDTEIAFTEDVSARFEALGWHTIWVKNGNTGYDEIRAAIAEAKAVTDKPTLIKACSNLLAGASLPPVNYFCGYGAMLCFCGNPAGDDHHWLRLAEQGQLLRRPWKRSRCEGS